MAWYNASWDYRVDVAIDPAQVPGTQTDFRLYVDLANMPDHFHSNVKAAGEDIRATLSDGVTEIAIDLVYITPGSKIGKLFILVPTVLSSSTTHVKVYYGNAAASAPAAGSTYGRNAVWTDNYDNVYHLDEDPSGGAPQMIDSTGNEDGTSMGTMLSGDSVTGKLSGNALDFDGSDDAIDPNINNDSPNWGNNLGTSSVSFWLKSSVTGAGFVPFGGRDNASNFMRYDISMNVDSVPSISQGAILVRVYDDSAVFTIGAVDTDTGVTDGAWHHIAVTYNEGTDAIAIYVDGVSQTVNYFSQNTPSNWDRFSAQSPYIGANNNAGVWEAGAVQVIDELRMAKTVLTTTTPQTIFNNEDSPSTFYSITGPGTPFTPQIINYF